MKEMRYFIKKYQRDYRDNYTENSGVKIYDSMLNRQITY